MRVEFVSAAASGRYVIARQLQDVPFSVSEASTLGDCRIVPQLRRPRALTADGQPDLSVFTVILKSVDALGSFQVGQEIYLEALSA